MLDVVIAHDYLTQRGGAERVVLAMARAFPDAPIVTSVYDPANTFHHFKDLDVRVARPLNTIPVLRRDPRLALPLLPAVWDRVVAPASQVMLCSSSGWAHGIKTSAHKIVYCHNPPRWLYQADEYLARPNGLKAWALAALAPRLRAWDQAAAQSAHRYLANSTAVQSRVRDTYGILADLLHPPASSSLNAPAEIVPGLPGAFLLILGRARGYKNLRLACEVMASMGTELALVIVGDLPEGHWPANIFSVANVSDGQLRWLYENAVGLLALGYEDFGLSVVEAATFGCPTIAWSYGGYLDTVIDGETGFLAGSLQVDEVRHQIMRLLRTPPPRHRVVQHGAQFAEAHFAARLQGIVREAT